MELVAIIPQDYDDLPEPVRRRIIPICIATFDRLGKPINPEWFSQGVAPVRRHLVRIAHYWLGDPWCVSELAEETVHRLSKLYGSVIPSYPARRVLKKANRLAVEINVGDWRKRNIRSFMSHSTPWTRKSATAHWLIRVSLRPSSNGRFCWTRLKIVSRRKPKPECK